MNHSFRSYWRKLVTREILLISLVFAVLLLFVRYIEYKWLIVEHSYEIYGGAIALLFTLLGIWIATKVIERKKEIVVVEKEVPAISYSKEFYRNQRNVVETGLSTRELEVLEKIAEGLSNQEIADGLFLSVNTVKTHSANILDKLQVKRRTQAVDKAKKLGLIP